PAWPGHARSRPSARNCCTGHSVRFVHRPRAMPHDASRVPSPPGPSPDPIPCPIRRVSYHAGTLLLEGPDGVVPGSVHDPLTGGSRVPAYRFADIAARADAAGLTLDGDLRSAWRPHPRGHAELG